MLSLEEEIAVVLNLCLLIQLLHEPAGSLHSCLLQLILNLVSVLLVLTIFSSLVDADNLEDECAGITLDGNSVEISLFGSDDSTSQRGL